MNLRNEFDIPASAIVLAEGSFGETGGKTANGVTLHSEVFDVEVVVDSTQAGTTASDVLGADTNGDIPVAATMSEAFEMAPDAAALVIGVAPAGGELPDEWVDDIKDAMSTGCSIVSGLHTFLSEDSEWQALAADAGVELYDVRKPPADDELRVGDGRVDDVDVPVVLSMGTDCAVGKRTTTFELYREACERGLDAGWVATGQTGIMVGAHRGAVIDRIPSDFTAGMVEDLVCEVAEDHEIVFVEGQASLSHRAYSGVTLSILHGAWPDAVVLVDDPDRTTRTHFERFEVWGIEREREFINELSDADVAAISTWGDQETVADRHGIPAGNVYTDSGTSRLFNAALEVVDE
ncbi:DUF1611 domain-containing protein [Natrialba sp. SSL1]|uniref:DUF1611 domain-containing protein n=1 Tax=Natrialba sp. SSL1 TaxID=1869245 RepID=UPI0008F835D9|nr:DUF1611 domain-containing protein [Natrialba sp. SSL1]OIB58939.1 hypothetical protein BBD46_06245 [Natrialba sp. SSL1]